MGAVLVPLHGLASRHDLPLPFPLVVAGAGVALLVSFVLLIFAWRRPRFTPRPGLLLGGLSRVWNVPAVRWVVRLAVLVLYLLVLAALFVGPDLLTNPVFGFVYVIIWVGLVPLSLLLGPVWRALNPLRTVHELLTRAARVDPDEGLVRLSRGVGVWPAAVALIGYAWLELVQPDRATAPVLRLWAATWLVGGILGAVVFGRRWIAAADPFEAYAGSVARLSWLSSDRDPADGSRRLRAVNPLRNLSGWTAPPGSAALVSVLLGSTAFDSFANTTWWVRTIQTVSMPSTLFATIGLLIMSAIVFGSFFLASAAMRPWTDRPVRELPPLMAPSVVPIVIGYAFAHYFTLLVVQSQQFMINLSDPFGLGWNLFGTAELGVNAHLYDHPTVIAFVQLGAIIAGHVLGIVAAHERAVQVLRRGGTIAGQVLMLVLMIGYTCAGLILLFSP